MMNLPLDATAILMISAECLTGKSNSPVMEAPDPSFFLLTLNTRIVLPLAKAVINALKHSKYYALQSALKSTLNGGSRGSETILKINRIFWNTFVFIRVI